MDLAIQICAGVGYAHRAGLVHCDIKPEHAGHTRRADRDSRIFGIARALATVPAGRDHGRGLGQPAVLWPNRRPANTPPRRPTCTRSVSCFEMLAGRLPFVASTQQQLAMMHLREEPPRLSMFNPNIPDTLELIVRAKVLAEDRRRATAPPTNSPRCLIPYRQDGDGHTGPLSSATPAGRHPGCLTQLGTSGHDTRRHSSRNAWPSCPR